MMPARSIVPGASTGSSSPGLEAGRAFLGINTSCPTSSPFAEGSFTLPSYSEYLYYSLMIFERARDSRRVSGVMPGAHVPRMGYRRTLGGRRSEEHTSELQSLMRNSYAVFC